VPKVKKTVRVFYSWQSDSPAITNLNAVRDCLSDACKALTKADPDLKLKRDEATRDTSGSPNIPLKILEKIEAADIFVADVTTVTPAGAARPCPNPNVGYELGYAVATLGWDRVILLFNEAHGVFPDDVPFDFAQNRAARYHIEETDPKAGRSDLTSLLRMAVKAIVEKNPKRPAELRGLSQEKVQHDHDVENMRWLMSSLHLPTLDDLIGSLPHKVPDAAFWFHTTFESIVTNSLFSVYDPVLKSAIQRLRKAWGTALRHEEEYLATPGGHSYIFTENVNFPMTPEREAIWEEIERASGEMHKALDTILNRLRDDYVEVKLRKTNKKAWGEYVREELAAAAQFKGKVAAKKSKRGKRS
jgi:hypothetical protein